jgi:hypothetical protein
MKNNISHMLEKAGLCGVATGFMGASFFGIDAYYAPPLLGMRVPLLLFTIPLGAANSFIADGIHTFVNQHIPLGKKTADKTAFITNAVVSGGSLVALMSIIDPNLMKSFSLLNAFLTGSVGEIVGSATYEYLLNNMYI